MIILTTENEQFFQYSARPVKQSKWSDSLEKALSKTGSVKLVQVLVVYRNAHHAAPSFRHALSNHEETGWSFNPCEEPLTA